MSVADDISVNPIAKREIICQVCNKSFKRGKDLKSHSVIHNDAKPFVCSQCPESFKHKTSLKRHSLIHSGEKPFMCRTCGKSFRQKGSLNEHSLTHTGEKPHICEVCNMGFTTKSNYGRHLKKHLLSKPFICEICHKGFNVRAYLTRHYDRHKEIDETVTSLKLQSESKKFFNGNDIVHVIKQSPSNVVVVSKDVVEVTDHEQKKYTCKMCNKHFREFCELRIHLLTHSNKKTYVCDICNRCFSSVGAFDKHKVTHDQKTVLPGECLNESAIILKSLETPVSNITIVAKKCATNNAALDKRYICNVCNKTFLKEYQFMHHSIIHKQPGPYFCDICGENIEFDTLQDLHKHLTEHGEVACICYNCNDDSITNDKYYSKGNVAKCDICYKCFPDKIQLRRHLSTHKNKRPFLIKLSA